MTYKQHIVIIVGFMLILLSSCSSNHATQSIKSVAEILHHMKGEGLILSSIKMPSEITSTLVERQEGYEIGDCKDIIYVYEYSDRKVLEVDYASIHRELFKLPLPNTPMFLSRANILMIYIKQDNLAFEVENKILASFGK